MIRKIGVCLWVVLLGNVAAKSLKMPIITETDAHRPAVVRPGGRGDENMAAEMMDEQERRQNTQVNVRLLPKPNDSINAESDIDLFPVAPIAKPIQMTLIARQQTATVMPATLNHQQPPHTRTPPRHSPNSREMVAELAGVDVDEYSDDPFEQRGATAQRS